nr:Photosystem I PsaA/PsaB [Ipomoea batatas]
MRKTLEWSRLLSSIDNLKLFDLCKEFGRLSLDENTDDNTGESSSSANQVQPSSYGSITRFLRSWRHTPWNLSITEQLKAPFIEYPRAYMGSLPSDSCDLTMGFGFRFLPGQSEFLTQDLKLPESFDSLGIGCTIWYGYAPGSVYSALEGGVFTPFNTYSSFFDALYDAPNFRKIHFLERNDISESVANAIGNEQPFAEIMIPASGNALKGVGLGVMVAFFLAVDPDIKIAVLPTKEDTFLLLGLSQLLLRLSGREQRKDKVKPLVGEGSAVYDLISSFLHLHIIDDDGHHKADICKLSKLILPLGDIARVLFHIVLMDLDREFKKRFSSIRYYRLLDEVYILTNDVIFDDKAGYALLEELGLAGQIESIGPGDDPLLCRRSWCSYTNSVYLGYDKYGGGLSFFRESSITSKTLCLSGSKSIGGSERQVVDMNWLSINPDIFVMYRYPLVPQLNPQPDLAVFLEDVKSVPINSEFGFYRYQFCTRWVFVLCLKPFWHDQIRMPDRFTTRHWKFLHYKGIERVHIVVVEVLAIWLICICMTSVVGTPYEGVFILVWDAFND